MRTHLDATFPAPDYDATIATWLTNFVPDPYDYGGPPLRVGILCDHGNKKTVYRAIDGDGANQMRSIYEFLESIGLQDLQLYEHPRFNCIYGKIGRPMAPEESYSVTALVPGPNANRK